MSDQPGSGPTVIDLVDQLEELVTTGRRVPFTTGVVVNEDEALELIDRTRLGLPDEIVQARHLLEDQRRVLADARDEAEHILGRAEEEATRILDEANAQGGVVIADAQTRAGALIAEAQAHVSALVSEHAIVEQAQEQATAVLAEAEERGAQTCSDADAYAREVMLRLEEQLMRQATTVRKGIDALPVEGGQRKKRRDRD
jgi:cell division septum initiation protein DivIVA